MLPSKHTATMADRKARDVKANVNTWQVVELLQAETPPSHLLYVRACQTPWLVWTVSRVYMPVGHRRTRCDTACQVPAPVGRSLTQGSKHLRSEACLMNLPHGLQPCRLTLCPRRLQAVRGLVMLATSACLPRCAC